ncbi:MAG TPA: hypothetical protein VND93_20910, partial [Myxococcales bacterium]|nr:hypothetical protein [Myxococcales bacterium]
RVLRNGALSSPVLLDNQSVFKGYPAAPEQTPSTWSQVPCAFGFTTDAGTGGQAKAVLWKGSSSASGGTLLLSDAFNRTGTSLGGSWGTYGLWRTDGRAYTDSTGADLAFTSGASCADCRVEANLIGFGVQEVGVVARAQAASPKDRYDVILRPDGHLQIRRVISGTVTVLAEGPSGIADLGNWANLQLTVQGTAPVHLVASVNGVQKLSASDSSPGPLAQAGHGGMWTDHAGVVFDDFALWALGAQ